MSPLALAFPCLLQGGVSSTLHHFQRPASSFAPPPAISAVVLLIDIGGLTGAKEEERRKRQKARIPPLSACRFSARMLTRESLLAI